MTNTKGRWWQSVSHCPFCDAPRVDGVSLFNCETIPGRNAKEFKRSILCCEREIAYLKKLLDLWHTSATKFINSVEAVRLKETGEVK